MAREFLCETAFDSRGVRVGHHGQRHGDDCPTSNGAEFAPLGDDGFRYEVVVQSPMGLHARPAARIVQLAGKFDCAVRIVKDAAAVVDGKSILQLLSLVATAGTPLTIETQGHDSLAAITALVELMRELNQSDGELA